MAKMVAQEGGWITRVPSPRMLVPLLLLVLLAGWPTQGLSGESTSQPKTPSAKECREHVEKALDQYFDSTATPTSGDQLTTNKEQTSPHAQPISTNENIDDDDDEDDPPLPSGTSAEQAIGDDGDEDDDEDNDDDDDDDAHDDSNKEIDTSTSEVSKNDDENDDDDEEDEDEEEDEVIDPRYTKYLRRDKVKHRTSDPIEELKNFLEEDEDDDDDEDDGDKDNNRGAKNSNDDEDLDDDDDDDDSDDDGDDETNDEENVNSTSKTSKNETTTSSINQNENISAKTSNINASVSVDEDDDDEDNDENDEDDDDDDDEKAVKDVKDTNDDDDDTDEEEDGDDDNGDAKIKEKEKPASTPIRHTYTYKPIVKASTITKTVKVTGATDSPTAGVASELPQSQPIPEQPKAQKDEEKASTPVKTAPVEGKASTGQAAQPIDDDTDDDEDDDDDEIENIYEDEDDDGPSPATARFRNRNHIDLILGLDDIGTDYDHQEDKLAQSIFRDIKKIHATSIRPIEMLYKYTDSTSRLLGDAEIFCKPMVLFLGPWSTGKTTIINYLLGIERTPTALKTGTGITDVDFTVITYGDQRQAVSGTELAADWQYASLQRFGQGFLDHFKAVSLPHTLLKKINIVDTPGILESRKNTERGYSFNDAFQWFIDRADAIYVVLDPSKVDIGAELGTVLDQLKGRDVRFILNKADTIRRTDLMRVVGQLFWNLSPLMSGTEAPIIYAVSLSTKPFNPSAPGKFLTDQENNFFYDLKDAINKRVENRILYARRHAVRVRNHAKMIDCYLATYYRHKSIFSSKRNVAKLITENPADYQIYEGLSSMTNVSRYDLPDPSTYKSFFQAHPLYDFKPLASTCSYFRGCPMEKLDNAIANELPELFTKYKKAKNSSPQPATKQDER